jgi:DNA-binding GntR family transcriptional regulator
MNKGLSRYVLADEIYAVLKEKILNHDISPGEKINIDRLGRDLEVSNIPIRESLSRLSAEGLVETIPFKGMFVAKLSLRELEEIFEIRMELERLALRKAASRIPSERLEALEQDMRNRKGSEIADSDERIRFISEMNEELHGLILKHCGNVSLESLIRSYIEKVQRYLSLSRKSLDQSLVQEEWEEHMSIVRSLASRDVAAADQALKQHLNNSLARNRTFFE